MSDITPQEVVNPKSGFPWVFAEEIIKTFQVWLPNHLVVPRPLRMQEAPRSIGVYPATWQEDEDSHLIGQSEAANNRYLMKIQVMTKHLEELIGRALFANDTKLVRVILYRDPELRVRLLSLQEELLESKEMVQKYRVVRQTFDTADLAGSFVFLSTTDLLIESSTTYIPGA